MVTAGDVIENPVTGETMRFVLTGRETNGELLRIDMLVGPGGFASAEHVHPAQSERFSVVSGQLTLRVGGHEQVYTDGQQLTIPAGTPHVWWNSGPDDVRVMVEFRPAGRFAEFITTFFALARAGKTDRRGLPTNLFQLAVTFAEYRDVLYGSSPPLVVQRLLFATVGRLGRWLGYRADEPYQARAIDGV